MIKMIKNRFKNLIAQMPLKANYKFLIKDWKPLFELERSAQLLETKRFFQNMSTILLERPEGQKFLVLAPHCDDDTFGAGGTILKLRDEGAEVHVLYFSIPGRTEQEIKKIRSEAENICFMQGITPHFLGLETRNFKLNPDSKKKILHILEQVQPEVVFTTFLLDDHIDHREVNNVFVQATVECNQDFHVWSYQIYSTVLPNVVVDITNEMPRKVELMDMWKSVQGNRNWSHYIKGINAANCRFVPGKGEIYAEAFFVVSLEEYRQLSNKYFGVI